MAIVEFTASLRDEYQRLFDSCDIKPEHAHEAEALVTKIINNFPRYDEVGKPLGIPRFLVGLIHCMEGSLRFTTHLHNGDPLTARTVHVPAGRPPTGSPPFAWEASAIDALELKHMDQWHDWSIPGILYWLEEYNGFGYRTYHPEVLTPYLWSFSNHYTSGKYVADGTFSATAISGQCGAAVLLRRLAERGAIHFDNAGIPLLSAPAAAPDKVDQVGPMVHFSESMSSPAVETLQRMLNTFPGIFVKVDGVPGTRTSDAFKRVTGYYLMGDPRAASVAST